MKNMDMFAGVNAPGGFVSKFNQIMQESPRSRKIFIKGGPGMGKSTFMKAVAKRAEEEGLFCELFHCSSDPASLDGVHIPALKTAIIDATAPHNTDPIYPSISGEIFDVSRFIRKERLNYDAEELAKTVEDKKKAFAAGYHYLSAALPILRLMDMQELESIQIGKIYHLVDQLAERLLIKASDGAMGEKREMFLSAVSSEGFVHFASSLSRATTCIHVNGNVSASLFLRRFAEVARMKGYGVTLFYCPMRPDEKVEHLYIPALSLFLTTCHTCEASSFDETVDVRIDACTKTAYLEHQKQAEALMQQAVMAYAVAKNLHSQLEAVYIPAMDFEALEREEKQFIDTIF